MRKLELSNNGMAEDKDEFYFLAVLYFFKSYDSGIRKLQ